VIKLRDYHINIFYSDEDKCYIADIPDLEHCSACGETIDEAFKEIKNAKKLWIESAKEIGKKIPEPRYKPVYYKVV
jgi:predicted RNase H-like HicB family nuclease